MDWVSTSAPDAASELTRVAIRGGDIAVIGDDFTGYGRRVFVKLSHTVDWHEHVPFGEDIDGRLLDLATNGGSFVAVGYEDTDVGDRRGVSHFSVTGTEWTRTLVDTEDTLIFDQVVTLPVGRYLAVASAPTYIVGECQPTPCMAIEEIGQAWVMMPDGSAWERDSDIYTRFEALPDELGDEIEHRRAVAAGSGGMVVFDRWFDALHVFWTPLAKPE
jgi:hypothetical protein